MWPSPTNIEGVSPHQRQAAAAAMCGPVGILTGGPGTGKTYTTAAILKAVASEHGIGSIAVAAPTGKAGVRIGEAMLANGLPIEGKTVHRTLGVTRNGHDGGGWGFNYNESNPLPFMFLVIEEASMLDVDLTASLVAACPLGMHILVVGDPGQLPPVGHGKPLLDMLTAGIPHGALTEVRRNSGDIVRACAEIRAGGQYRPSKEIDIDQGHNLKHIESGNSEQSIRRLESMLTAPPEGTCPVWDCQVIVARNEYRQTINKRLQGLLNPGGRKMTGSPFRDGDKVICTENSWLPLAEDTEADDFVANGEIGRIVRQWKPKRGKLRAEIAFDSPCRSVIAVGEFLGKFDLAYAITVHKSQGSQAPVIFYVSDGSTGVPSRQLIYTALSRAESLCVTIGKLGDINRDLKRDALQHRKTFLAEDLAKGIACQGQSDARFALANAGGQHTGSHTATGSGFVVGSAGSSSDTN